MNEHSGRIMSSVPDTENNRENKIPNYFSGTNLDENELFDTFSKVLKQNEGLYDAFIELLTNNEEELGKALSNAFPECTFEKVKSPLFFSHYESWHRLISDRSRQENLEDCLEEMCKSHQLVPADDTFDKMLSNEEAWLDDWIAIGRGMRAVINSETSHIQET